MYTAVMEYDRSWAILNPEGDIIAYVTGNPDALLSHLNR
jgi:hypothetical protein